MLPSFFVTCFSLLFSFYFILFSVPVLVNLPCKTALVPDLFLYCCGFCFSAFLSFLILILLLYSFLKFLEYKQSCSMVENRFWIIPIGLFVFRFAYLVLGIWSSIRYFIREIILYNFSEMFFDFIYSTDFLNQ